VKQLPWGYQGWQGFKNPSLLKPKAPMGPVEGDLFPKCRLALLQTENDAAYLGVPPGSRYFSLTDINGDYFLVEVYDEMCSLCLKALPVTNRLFQLLNKDGPMKKRIKLLGLGAGSTKRSVAKFRRRKGYDIPLFADEKRRVFELLGKPMLPVIFLLKKIPGKGLRIMLRHEGSIGNPETFLAHLKGYMKPQGQTTD
jgi:hypothetical protein